VARPDAGARSTFADGGDRSPADAAPVRRSAARIAAIAVRLIAPVAAAVAALAGLLFAALLPICGIATICEGIALTSWRFVRESVAHLAHRPAPRA
jgi:hypothetical protein